MTDVFQGTVSGREVYIIDDVNNVLVVLEAMKMEHIITAPSAGQVVELKCSVGDIVGDGSILAVVQDVASENVSDAA